MASNKTKNIIRLVHKWLGLILGLQILFWVAGGVVMSIFPLDTVRGDDRAKDPVVVYLSAEDFKYPLAKILQQYPQAKQVQADYWMGQAVYRVISDKKELLVDATNGTSLSPISSEMAMQVALSDYTEQTAIIEVNQILTAEGEVRGREGVLWQVLLDDNRNTRIYVSQSNGKVVARRNDVWRLYDFFWMLHIMDYDERKDFNNLLLQAFAIISLLFVVSGLWLFLYSFKRKDFAWIIGRSKN